MHNIPHHIEHVLTDWYQHAEFIDDVPGRPLDKRMAIQARTAEMQFFRKMSVYTTVDRSTVQGKIITTRWLDVNKGDDDDPDYRARLVGREIKKEQRLDLFAPTPPIESPRYIISKCAQPA